MTPSAAHFPVTRSVLSADALVPVLQEAYDLNVPRCQLIKAFILSTYHVATDDGNFI